MATLDKAEALLEELRVASVEAARRDLDEVAAFAAEQARDRHWGFRVKELMNSGELRVASVEAARRDLDKVATFAAEQARDRHGLGLGYVLD